MFKKADGKQNKISIIIPVYNIEKYIEKCLMSVKEQTYSDFEVLLVDDGSTDNTGKICDIFSEEDYRFKVFHKKNEGVSTARNFGLKKAKGRYISFVDGDDYLDKDYLKVLVKYMNDENVDLTCVDFYIDSQKEIDTESLNNTDLYTLSKKDAINQLCDKKGFQGYLWNKLFKRRIIEENNIYFDERIKIWEDMLFCLKYLTHCHKIAYVRKPLYYYVQRKDSAMGNSSIWKENTQVYALEQMWDIVKNYDGGFKEYIRDFYANDLIGRLFKNKNESYIDIKHKIKLIDELNGRLTFKHKIKIVIIKLFPWEIMKSFYKS